MPQNIRQIYGNSHKVIETIMPGQWRQREVQIGEHLPCAPTDIDELMTRFCDTYQPLRFFGAQKLIAILCAHHRFSWIHPFLDGNGRVARLFTDAGLRAVGVDTRYWSLSQGMARTTETYRQRLADADRPRQGDRDGRGQLTEAGLVALCDYLLETAQAEVSMARKTLTW